MRGGTLYGLIFYPEDVAPADPSPSYPTVMDDNRGGYIFRSGWDGTDHSIVGLWGDTTNYGRSWSQADARPDQPHVLWREMDGGSRPGDLLASITLSRKFL